MEKRGGRKTSRMTPLPKRGFGPPSYGTFSTPLRCQCSVFPVQKSPRQSSPKALLEGSKHFRERAFSGTFSSPHTFCTPPYHGPIETTTAMKRRKISCSCGSDCCFGKIQRVKTQRAKTSENFAEEKECSQKMFQKISQISLLLDFIVFLDIFEIFAEDCFLLRSFRKF